MKALTCLNELLEAIIGRKLKRDLDRHSCAADALDAAVKEMLHR